MKKIVSFALSLMLALSIMSPALATSTVPVNGSIGIQNSGTYQIEFTAPSAATSWTVDDVAGFVGGGPYNITNDSADGVNLKVTIDSFTQTNSVTIPGTLSFSLTGNLANDGVGSIDLHGTGITSGTNSQTYTAIMKGANTNGTGSVATGDSWTFNYTGTYTGSYPATAVTPTYSMVLNFAIDSVTP